MKLKALRRRWLPALEQSSGSVLLGASAEIWFPCDRRFSNHPQSSSSFWINTWNVSHRRTQASPDCLWGLWAVWAWFSQSVFCKVSRAKVNTHGDAKTQGEMPLNWQLAKRCSINWWNQTLLCFIAQIIKKQNKKNNYRLIFNSGRLLHRLHAVSQLCTPVSHVNENHQVALDRRSWVMQCS